MRLLKTQALGAAKGSLGMPAGPVSLPTSCCSPGQRCSLINMDKYSQRQKSPNGEKAPSTPTLLPDLTAQPESSAGCTTPVPLMLPSQCMGCPCHHLPARGQDSVPSCGDTRGPPAREGTSARVGWTRVLPPSPGPGFFCPKDGWMQGPRDQQRGFNTPQGCVKS